MSSILLSASPWNNSSGTGGGGNTTRKRTPTITKKPKTIRNMSSSDDDNDGNEFENSNISENFQSTMANQDARNSKVNQLLDKMNETDAGSGLADFVPVAPPKEKFMGKTSLADLMPLLSNSENTTTDTESMFEGFDNGESHYNSEFGPNAPNDRVLSNYMQSYEPAGILGKPYYATSAGSNSNSNGDISQKLNYMTRILEELQMEKTSNITEELILYSFLGVFVIFVVDSFAKAGKYYR